MTIRPLTPQSQTLNIAAGKSTADNAIVAHFTDDNVAARAASGVAEGEQGR